MSHPEFIKHEELFSVAPLKSFRHTQGVSFDILPMEFLPAFASVDRVLHQSGAVSPGPVGEVARPWYMHPYQEDHLLVMHGRRTVELYTRQHGRIETLEVSAERVLLNGKVFFDGAGFVIWRTGVFHRIKSDEVLGSASLNFAVRHPGFDIMTNFNIYDLDPATGKFQTLRKGHLDQFGH